MGLTIVGSELTLLQGDVLKADVEKGDVLTLFEKGYKEKLRMIRIVNRALDGKFVYPTGRDFDGCAAGFLPVLAPYLAGDEHAAAKRISRSQCLDMNDIAAELVRPLGEV